MGNQKKLGEEFCPETPEEHSPVDTGMLAHGDSLQTPSKQNCKEKSEFSLCQAPLSMGFSGKNTGMVAMPSSRGSS